MMRRLEPPGTRALNALVDTLAVALAEAVIDAPIERLCAPRARGWKSGGGSFAVGGRRASVVYLMGLIRGVGHTATMGPRLL